jgi:hypothetical protein
MKQEAEHLVGDVEGTTHALSFVCGPNLTPLLSDGCRQSGGEGSEESSSQICGITLKLKKGEKYTKY